MATPNRFFKWFSNNIKKRVWPIECGRTLKKSGSTVPVHVSGVPVHFGHCPFLRNMYRYMLKVYRYTCSNLAFFFIFSFFFIIYIFLKIGNSGAGVKSVLVDCLPSRVLLHAHLFFCSYSTQTDCIHGIGHCISFFGHFQSFHGVHYFSSDQGS